MVSEKDYFPKFEAFADFIKSKAKISNHTLWEGYSSNVGVQRASTHVSEQNVSVPNSSVKQIQCCTVCKSTDHYITKCPEFMSMSLAERKGAIMKNRLCYGYLRGGHQSKDCRGKHTCMVCKLKHPSLLHDYNKTQNNDSVNQQTQIKEQASSHNVDICTPNRATTMIVPVLVTLQQGKGY